MLTPFNRIITKSIMVIVMEILLILIFDAYHTIYWDQPSSHGPHIHTMRLQCKLQFGQINLIFKSWFVPSKIAGLTQCIIHA